MKLAIVLALSWSVPPTDRWFARDKLQHFLAAAAVQSLAYAAVHRHDDRRRTSLWQASAVTAGISLGKEVLDRRRGGAFSGRDLAWDAAGVGAASLAIIHWSRP